MVFSTRFTMVYVDVFCELFSALSPAPPFHFKFDSQKLMWVVLFLLLGAVIFGAWKAGSLHPWLGMICWTLCCWPTLAVFHSSWMRCDSVCAAWVMLIKHEELGGGFKDFWNVHPHLGKIPNLTNIFRMGWNHQLDKLEFLRKTLEAFDTI